MLNLWDRQINPREDELESLSVERLANLALDFIESAVPLFEPKFDDFFPREYSDLINSAIARRTADPQGWLSDREFADRFLERYDELPKVAVRPAVGPFMMALVRLFEGISEQALDLGEVMEIASSSYEAILLTQVTGRAIARDEESSVKCQAAIGVQNRLIDAYVSP